MRLYNPPKGIVLVILATLSIVPLVQTTKIAVAAPKSHTFVFQSIDTMKYSRDAARGKLTDIGFDQVIDQQIGAIAATGATHVAIATPYDAEFVPILERWVASARQHKLKVWFRGNWSGWEGWFDYPRIDRVQHLESTRAFILEHSDLFANGDVFTACPECENGGPGDPRMNQDASGHRQFLIDEYEMTKSTFAEIQKKVASNFLSMNGDVATLIMDKRTTKQLDGIVTIDHYVKTPEKLDQDITKLAKQSGGKIVLGEWGTPIPDIHGKYSEAQQKAWIERALKLLGKNRSLYGMNYWVGTGGSTALWNNNATPRSAVSVLTDWYSPRVVSGIVRDWRGRPLSGVTVTTSNNTVLTNAQGKYQLPLSIRGDQKVGFSLSRRWNRTFYATAKTATKNITLYKKP